MVQKQALSQKCVCGQAMEFPGGQVKVTCSCGAVWELGPEGFWSITSFVLILVKPTVVEAAVKPTVKLKADEYPRYPRSKKRRKAGSRCLESGKR